MRPFHRAHKHGRSQPAIGFSPPKQSSPILIFLYESAQNALFHTKYLKYFLGMGHSLFPRPYHPLGTYGTSTPGLRRGLDAFGSCFRGLSGLKPLNSKNHGYVPAHKIHSHGMWCGVCVASHCSPVRCRTEPRVRRRSRCEWTFNER